MINLFKIIQSLTVRRLCFIISNFVIVVMVILYVHKIESDKSTDEESTMYKKNDLMCHYLKDEGALKALDNLVKFQPDAIFFIESSCEGLTSRQACSVESAARAHPNRQVNVLFTSPLSWKKYKTNGLSVILLMDNTDAARIHLEEFSKETPFYATLKNKLLSPNGMNMNIGEILKYVTMYKYSGVYLGLDVLVVRPFNDMKDNWIVKETPTTISADMFAFSRNKTGRSLAEKVLKIVLHDLNLPHSQSLWTMETRNAMNKLASIWCTSPQIQNLGTSMCKDLQVMEPDGFIPIPVQERQKYFAQTKWKPSTNETIYTYQTFDYLTKYIILPKNSLYDNLARKYCPSVYEFYGEHFGLY